MCICLGVTTAILLAIGGVRFVAYAHRDVSHRSHPHACLRTLDPTPRKSKNQQLAEPHAKLHCPNGFVRSVP